MHIAGVRPQHRDAFLRIGLLQRQSSISGFQIPYAHLLRARQRDVELQRLIRAHRGRLIEIQGTGEGRPFTVEEQRQLVDLCAGGIRQLQSIQRSALEQK